MRDLSPVNFSGLREVGSPETTSPLESPLAPLTSLNFLSGQPVSNSLEAALSKE